MFELVYRYDPAHPTDRRPPASVEEARRFLEEGNATFASLATTEGDARRVVWIDLEDLGISRPGGVLEQKPFACVLGCADARVPTELIFDRSCNELFVVRVAGNTLGQEPLGSIDYAVTHFHDDLKLIVVLGHSQCGAVTAAVDAFLTPMNYLGLASDHEIRAIVNGLFPAVRGAAVGLKSRWGEDVVAAPGYRAALIDCAVAVNAAVMAAILQDTFGGRGARQQVLFGVYDLATRRVGVPVEGDAAAGMQPHLVEAPASGEPFRRFTYQVAGSEPVRRLLGR